MWRMGGEHGIEGARFFYRQLLYEFLKLVPERLEEFAAAEKEKRQGNGKGQPQFAKKEAPRSFGEITSKADLEKRCLTRRACAIALLPAITSIDYEMAAHTDRMEMLAELDK